MKKFKFWQLDIILVVLLVLILSSHYLNSFALFMPQSLNDALLMVFAGLGALPVIVSAFGSLKKKRVSIDLLASIALLVSLIAHEWTSASFINLMLASARLFGQYTESRARGAIQSLLKLKPKTAKIEKNGAVIKIPIEQIKKGDLVVVELGERIPIDGVVEKGQASVDQSSLTGESIPMAKKEHDEVLSSSIVVQGNLLIKTEKIGKETALEKIIDLVEKSQVNKAKISNLSDKFTSWYIILTILGSLGVYFFSQNLNLVLAILLVTCADDIAIAIPMAFLAAIGHAAKRGIIIKGSNFIEILARLKVVVVDKTGTLTRGRLKVDEFLTFSGVKPDEALQYAGVISMLSNHPAAKAIVNYVRENHIVPPEPEKFEEYPGHGSLAKWQNGEILSGKLSFFREKNVKIMPEEVSEINKAKDKGLNVTLIALNGRMICFAALADELRPQTKDTIKELKQIGIEKIVMLTGDNEKIAKRVADQVGISEFHANLLPEDKTDYLKKYLGHKQMVAMIGDGVNDAAALSLADVGIAMGAIGSDAAIESADIALMKDDLSKVPECIRLAKFTLKVARQDFWIWGVLNAAGLLLVFSGFLIPAYAAAYNFLTDFLPLINSSRLFKMHLRNLSDK